MEIRNPIQPQAPTQRQGAQGAARKDETARFEAYTPSEDVEESPRRERVAPPPLEGQLLDNRLAFDMLQAARQTGQAGDTAYGEGSPSYMTQRALNAYEGEQQAAQYDEGAELLPRFSRYV